MVQPEDIRVDAFVQVRLSSKRVPRKALLRLGNDSCLGHVVEHLGAAKLVARAIVCTSTDDVDDPLVDFADARKVPVFRGEPDNCLDRFLACAREFDTDIIVRVCGDSPLVSSVVVDGIVGFLLSHRCDYVSAPSVPVGTYVEAFTVAALQRAILSAIDATRSDDLTLFLRRPEINDVRQYQPPAFLRRDDLVLALNRAIDVDVLTAVFADAPRKADSPTLEEAISYLDARPDLAALNRDYVPVPTRCDTRLDPSRLPARPAMLPWYEPLQEAHL